MIDAYTTKVDDNTKAINTVQLTLNSVTGELTSKVSKGDLVSTINQTAGAVKISANCIDLEGYVTAKEFETVSGWVDTFNGDLFQRHGANLITWTQDKRISRKRPLQAR